MKRLQKMPNFCRLIGGGNTAKSLTDVKAGQIASWAESTATNYGGYIDNETRMESVWLFYAMCQMHADKIQALKTKGSQVGGTTVVTINYAIARYERDRERRFQRWTASSASFLLFAAGICGGVVWWQIQRHGLSLVQVLRAQVWVQSLFFVTAAVTAFSLLLWVFFVKGTRVRLQAEGQFRSTRQQFELGHQNKVTFDAVQTWLSNTNAEGGLGADEVAIRRIVHYLCKYHPSADQVITRFARQLPVVPDDAGVTVVDVKWNQARRHLLLSAVAESHKKIAQRRLKRLGKMGASILGAGFIASGVLMWRAALIHASMSLTHAMASDTWLLGGTIAIGVLITALMVIGGLSVLANQRIAKCQTECDRIDVAQYFDQPVTEEILEAWMNPAHGVPRFQLLSQNGGVHDELRRVVHWLCRQFPALIESLIAAAHADTLPRRDGQVVLQACFDHQIDQAQSAFVGSLLTSVALSAMTLGVAIWLLVHEAHLTVTLAQALSGDALTIVLLSVFCVCLVGAVLMGARAMMYFGMKERAWGGTEEIGVKHDELMQMGVRLVQNSEAFAAAQERIEALESTVTDREAAIAKLLEIDHDSTQARQRVVAAVVAPTFAGVSAEAGDEGTAHAQEDAVEDTKCDNDASTDSGGSRPGLPS